MLLHGCDPVQLEPGRPIYRPVVSTSLAVDYFVGRGYKPFFFHLSTFVWFAVQLILMFFLFRRIMDHADPHPSNIWVALLAAACYGLHPANAETVNYIIQRADLYDALGVVASLLFSRPFPGSASMDGICCLRLRPVSPNLQP